jgi:hypothetical protein
MATAKCAWNGSTPPAGIAGRLFSPLDNELALLPGKYSPLLHQRLVQTGNQVPSFARAAELFETYTATPACEATVRRYAERAGSTMLAVVRGGEGAEGPGEPPRLYASVDGANVPLVGGRWVEVRTLVIGEVLAEPEAEPRCINMSYFSRLATAEEFLDLVEPEVKRRGLDRAREAGFGSDGAPWCQRFPQRYCPGAVRGLDFWHAAGYVHDFSKVLWPATEGNQQWWAGEMLHDLKHHGPWRLLRSLAGWAALGGRGKLGKAAGTTLGYFEAREALLDYPALRAAGWPIGTGGVESANKLVVEERMKGPGMHWGEAHVNPMLALRNAQCSRRWEQEWAATAARLTRERTPALSVHAKT